MTYPATITAGPILVLLAAVAAGAAFELLRGYVKKVRNIDAHNANNAKRVLSLDGLSVPVLSTGDDPSDDVRYAPPDPGSIPGPRGAPPLATASARVLAPAQTPAVERHVHQFAALAAQSELREASERELVAELSALDPVEWLVISPVSSTSGHARALLAGPTGVFMLDAGEQSFEMGGLVALHDLAKRAASYLAYPDTVRCAVVTAGRSDPRCWYDAQRGVGAWVIGSENLRDWLAHFEDRGLSRAEVAAVRAQPRPSSDPRLPIEATGQG